MKNNRQPKEYFFEDRTLNRDTFTDRHFLALGSFIEGNFGIKMPGSKKTMVEARLRRRMNKAGYHSLRQYLEYAFSSDGRRYEMVNLVDTITTNKTDFFREPVHFDFLAKQLLPKLMDGNFFQHSPTLKVWSSACSSGEEPYTIAMILQEFADRNGDFKYSILASDLSTRVLKKACLGVYREEQVTPIPLGLRKKYLLKSEERSLGLVRISEQLRNAVVFNRINLMDEDFGIKGKMHIIFCRNVLIYFSRSDQERLMQKFYTLLERNGFLFIGHSETIMGMDVPFVQIMPTVYIKKE